MKQATTLTDLFDSPVTILEQGESIETLPNGVHCVVTKKGIFNVIKNNMFTNVAPFCSFKAEATCDAKLTIHLPKIDVVTQAFLHVFFKKVYQTHHSEVNTLLYYSAEQGRWYIRVPKQTVTAASATSELTDDDVWIFAGTEVNKEELPADLMEAGTAHSHGAMGAFFSGTDDKDDNANYGYQIVIGKVATTAPETKCRFTAGRVHVDLKEDEVFGAAVPTFPDAIPGLSMVTPTYASYTYPKGKAAWTYGGGPNAGWTDDLYGDYSYHHGVHSASQSAKRIGYSPPSSYVEGNKKQSEVDVSSFKVSSFETTAEVSVDGVTTVYPCTYVSLAD